MVLPRRRPELNRAIVEVFLSKRGTVRLRIRIQSKRMPPGSVAALRRAVARLERAIVRASPFKTGKLRRSIRRRGSVAGKGSVITVAVRYAKFLERGTRYIRARRFVRKALLDFANSLEPDIFDVRLNVYSVVDSRRADGS